MLGGFFDLAGDFIKKIEEVSEEEICCCQREEL